MNSTRVISFGGKSIKINSANQQSDALLSALFKDTAQTPAYALPDVTIAFDNDKFHYEMANGNIFSHTSINEFGAVIMSDVIYRLIKDNHHYLAIHAALISNDKHCILMPAASGSGKSSITTWCMLNGFRYHSDEMVIINPTDFSLQAFTRPVKLRRSGLKPISAIVNFSMEAVENDYPYLFSSNTIMLPHRLLNANYQKEIPPLSAIIFPQYDGTNPSLMEPLSSAKTSMALMSSNVIARNFEDFGFSNICQLARSQPGYFCRFRHFDDLAVLFKEYDLI